MRIRTIKPSFWTSPDIADLPDDTHRLFFIGLWNYADDEGRGVDDPRIIKGAIFPLNDEIRPADVDAMMWRLPSVTRYTVASRNYFEISTWGQHQKISHPRASDIPKAWGEQRRHRDSGNLLEASGNVPEASGKKLVGSGSGSGSGSGRGKGNGAIVPVGTRTLNQRGNDLAKGYCDLQPLSNFPAVAGICRKALKAGHADTDVAEALGRLVAEGRGVTTETLRIELEGLPARRAAVPDRGAEILKQAYEEAQRAAT